MNLSETDSTINILSLTQVYLDILCHVTYILDTLQDDLDRHVCGQGSVRLALSYVGRRHLELDPFRATVIGLYCRFLIPYALTGGRREMCVVGCGQSTKC